MADQKALPRIGHVIADSLRNFLIIIGIVTVFFSAANFLAYRYGEPPPPDINDTFSATLSPESQPSLTALKEIFRVTTDEEALARFRASPNFVFNPTLPFATSTVKNKYFHVGVEGARYQLGWNDELVRSLLKTDRQASFIFGGSTTLGHGVADDETWPYHLNQLRGADPKSPFINFGAQAYNQRVEIEKLILLLKRGYRPKSVIFLDGWNDIWLARSNMRLEDDIIYHGFAINRGEVAFTPETVVYKPNYLSILARTLPITRWIEGWSQEPLNIESVRFDRDAATEGFNFREAEFVFRNWARFGELHREQFKSKIIQYYQSNLKLLRALAVEYDFRLMVFYQPILFLDNANVFVPPRARQEPGYRYVEEIVSVVRSEIAAGRLSMIDLAGALDGVRGHRTIDIAHYTPESNLALAKAIKRFIDAGEPSVAR